MKRPIAALAAVLLASSSLLAACGSDGPAIEQGDSKGPVMSSGSGNTGGGGSGGSGGAGGVGGEAPSADLDGDGIDDSLEQTLAETYLPFLSLDPEDGCSLGGIVFRLYPHPMDPSLIHIVYDHLFETDCGLNGHTGDNEVFGATINPKIPPPSGILALRAVTHQGQVCEKTTQCGTCPGLNACATAMKNGQAYPVAFSSKDKHATYVEKDQCNFFACFDSCSLNDKDTPVVLVNAGEPSAHLTEDLTKNGFITAENGWTKQELFNINPWDPDTEFGGAGNIAEDLQDPAFLTPVCP
jgi:hypothetical protein